VRILLDARPCQQHGTMTMRLPAFRILYFRFLLFGVGSAKRASADGERQAPPLTLLSDRPPSRFT
jgi:hypothetical protein